MILAYSPIKNIPQRMPEYAVPAPATISVSFSVRHNGVRLHSTKAAIRNNAKQTGSFQINHLSMPPLCALTMSMSESEPVIITIGIRLRPFITSKQVICKNARNAPIVPHLL